jgi:Flp pilus assembly protein TadG
MVLQSLTKKSGSRGQSLVEITLITPLLLVALYIPVDFGVAFFMGNILATVARDGARIGSGQTKTGGTAADPDFRNQDADTLEAAIVSRLPNYLTSRQIQISFYENDGAPCMESIEVTVSGSYNVFFYRLIYLFRGTPAATSINLSRTSRMRYNYQPYSQGTPCANKTVDRRSYSISDA